VMGRNPFVLLTQTCTFLLYPHHLLAKAPPEFLLTVHPSTTK
jgi:hypothetical protein